MTLYAPALRVGLDGAVGAESSQGFEWIVHRRRGVVVFLATSLAGLGAGDELDARVTLAPGASATVTGQGPTSLLASNRIATHRWRLNLGAGAHLTYLPWLNIPFPCSRSQLEVDVCLGERSSLVAWETVSVGRVASGERFLFHELRSSWRISSPAGLLLDDRLLVRGSDSRQGGTMLGGHTHLGWLIVAGAGEAVLPLAEVRRRLEGALELVGASRPVPELLVVRALDAASERLERAFWPVVTEARLRLGCPPLDPSDVARRWFGA